MTWRWKTMKTIERRQEDQDRARAEQRDVGRVVALERAERAGHRALRAGPRRAPARAGTGSRPRPTSGSRATRSARRASGTWIRQNRSQVLAPSTRAASEISAGMFTKWARIQNTANGMYSADERQDDREPRVEDPELPGEEVERRDDALERQRQAEHEQEQQPTRAPGMRRRPMAKPAIVEITSEIGTTASTMNTLENEQRAHVRDLERVDEVAPLRIRRPRRGPSGTLPDGWSAVVKMLRNGQDRDRHQRPAAASDRRRARVRATLIVRRPGSAAGSAG